MSKIKHDSRPLNKRQTVWETPVGVWVLDANRQDGAQTELARALGIPPDDLPIGGFRRIPGPDRAEVQILDIDTGETLTVEAALADWRANCRANDIPQTLPHQLAAGDDIDAAQAA